MSSWQTPTERTGEREKETKTERERERSEKTMMECNGKRSARGKRGEIEKERDAGQKREVSLSRADVACARSGRTGPINIVETRQINLKLSHVARQKGTG